MTTDALLDRLLVPRPNGSEGLEQVAAFIEATLRRYAPSVTVHSFTATPYGFQLLWAVTFVLMAASVVAIARRRYALAVFCILLTPALMLAETEWLWSPVSGLLPRTEHNVAATFPRRAGAPTLIFSAHYDSATHFGDHFDWHRWGWRTGPAIALALSVALLGLWRTHRGLSFPRRAVLPVASISLVPFAVMAWFFAVGPLLRMPSPGAVDNGGAVAVLLRLAERVSRRPADAAISVQLVFLAAEEERALGSWHYARTLSSDVTRAVINLESVGADEQLAYAPEEGFQFRRYPSAPALVALVRGVARDLWGHELVACPLPAGIITDGRSFLAHGIPAVTLLSASPDGFPRRLHSAHDNRDRLSVPALERTVDLLYEIVARIDRDPNLLARPVEEAHTADTCACTPRWAAPEFTHVDPGPGLASRDAR